MKAPDSACPPAVRVLGWDNWDIRWYFGYGSGYRDDHHRYQYPREDYEDEYDPVGDAYGEDTPIPAEETAAAEDETLMDEDDAVDMCTLQLLELGISVVDPLWQLDENPGTVDVTVEEGLRDVKCENLLPED